jgi:hypothetical protein
MAVINQPNFFPASREITRYFPNVMLINNVQLSLAGLVWLYPIFIKKYAENPTFCMEVTTYTSVVGTLIVSAGIYQGVDIFSSGALLFSTDFTLTGSGVKKNSSTLKLSPGWYTMASLIKVVQTSGTVNYRSVLQNLSNPLFGTAPNAAFFNTLYGTFGINSASLPANLSGQTIVKQPGAGILVALEY